MKKTSILILLLILSTSNFSLSTTPKRAISASHFTTEILLSIGAENQIVGTAWADNSILPELKEKYDKIPVLSEKGMSKELFYSMNPDFLTGWDSILSPNNLGPLEELEKNGVRVFNMKSLKSEKIEDLYDDILMYGKIFNLEDNAQTLVRNMKKNLEEIKLTLPKEKVKIFAYDSRENTPFTIGGSGIANTIINLAGGENIFGNVKGNFVNGSWEKVIDENPEVIVIVDYGTSSSKNKIKYLKENSPIKDLAAVKNNKFVVVELVELSSGIRIVDGIKTLIKGLHGNGGKSIEKND